MRGLGTGGLHFQKATDQTNSYSCLKNKEITLQAGRQVLVDTHPPGSCNPGASALAGSASDPTEERRRLQPRGALRGSAGLSATRTAAGCPRPGSLRGLAGSRKRRRRRRGKRRKSPGVGERCGRCPPSRDSPGRPLPVAMGQGRRSSPVWRGGGHYALA